MLHNTFKFLFCIVSIFLISHNLSAQTDHKEFTGIWGFLGAENDVALAKRDSDIFYNDWLKGTIISVKWSEIQPRRGDGNYRLDKLTQKLNKADEAGIKNAIVLVYHGKDAPHWIYGGRTLNGDPNVTMPITNRIGIRTNPKAGDGVVPLIAKNVPKGRNITEVGYWPDYLDNDYKIYHRKMVYKVRGAIQSWKDTNNPDSMKILAVQAANGKSGDPSAYFTGNSMEYIFKGSNNYPVKTVGTKTYLNGYLSLGSTTPNGGWLGWLEDLYSLYVNAYRLSDDEPQFKVLFNVDTKQEATFKRAVEDKILINRRDNILKKTTGIHQGYQLPGEVNAERLAQNVTKGAEKYYMRGELGSPINKSVERDSPETNGVVEWWNKRPEQNLYWSILWMLHMGQDIYNVANLKSFRLDTDYKNETIDIFKFFSQRAGYKNPSLIAGRLSEEASEFDEPQLSPYAFIALREGLDFRDNKYINYVSTRDDKKKVTRYEAILDKVKRGAILDDKLTLTSTFSPALYSERATGVNDVIDDIDTGNYTMFMTLLNPNDSKGYWNRGKKDVKYGRFARGFAAGKNTLYFDLNDEFQDPANSCVDVSVIYYAKAGDEFNLVYSKVGGGTKSEPIKGIGANRTWRTAPFSLTDAKLNLSGKVGLRSDIMLRRDNTNPGNNPLFHMIHVEVDRSGANPCGTITERIKNGGFEHHYQDWILPADPDDNIKIVSKSGSSNVITGTRSAKIKSNGSWQTIKQSIASGNNKRYQVSASVKTINMTSSTTIKARVRVSFLDAGGTVLAHQTREIAGENTTRHFTFGELIAPSGTNRLEIKLQLSQGTGAGSVNAFFDNISIKEIQ